MRRAFLRFDRLKFYLFERFGGWKRAVDAVLFISSEEIEHPNFTGAKRRILVRPSVPAERPPSWVNDFARRENMLLYVGNLKLADNRAAVLLAYRELRELIHRHDWRLAVCGRSDDPSILAELRGDPLITCTFNLTPDELAAFYARAKAFACFSENRAGVKLKLLEPILAGLPVVANDNAVAGSGLASAALLFSGASATARETLVELLDVGGALAGVPHRGLSGLAGRQRICNGRVPEGVRVRPEPGGGRIIRRGALFERR